MAKYSILIKKNLPFNNYSGDNIAVLYNIHIIKTNTIDNFISGRVIYNYVLLVLTKDTAACI